MKGGFVLYNGKFFREDEPIFTGTEIDQFDIGIRESFRTENNLILFAKENYNHLVNSLKSIDLQVPNSWNFNRLTKDVSRLLNKNHFYLAAKVFVTFFGGISGTNYLLRAEECQRGFFPVTETGLLIDFYEEGQKMMVRQNGYEPASRFIWNTATQSMRLLSKPNLLILNNEGGVCEAVGGSFGYITDGFAIFPSESLQGYTPALMEIVKECAAICKLKGFEKKYISREDILNAEEVFLISNVEGIIPVLGVGNETRYYISESIKMAVTLRDLTVKEQQQIPDNDNSPAFEIL